MTKNNMNDEAQQTPKPNSELKSLDRLVGTWELEHRDLNTNEEWGGKDTFEWLPGGYFMAYHHEEDRGVKGVMILGYEKGWEETEPGKELIGHWFESSSGSHYKYIWEVDDSTVSFWLNDKQSNMSFRGEFSEDGTTITGTGDTTLLFVHGSYIDQTYWKEQVNFFSHRYKVVTFDLPGHGNSGKERTHWSVKDFAEDVHAVIKELDLKNVILIGHSLGGDINLIAATSYPENIIGFIGIDNFKNAATPLPQEYQQQAVSIQKNLKTDFANTNEQYARMALLTKQTSPAITNRVIKDYRNAYQPMGLETTPEVFNMFETEKKLLPQLKLKLYLINVDYTPTNEASLKQYVVNGYEVLHMKGSCHFPMLENPEELNKLLEQTMEKISNKI